MKMLPTADWKIPKNWEIVSIGELTSDWKGGAPLRPEDFTDEGFPILHKGAIQRGGKIVIDVKKKTFTTVEYAQSHPQSVIDKTYMAATLRDLVPTGPSIGLIADLTNSPSPNYVLAQGAYGFHVDKDRVEPAYLVHLSNYQPFRRYIKRYCVGSTQIHIRTPVFQALEIPLPPLDEQRRIATVLDKADASREKRRQAINKLDTLLQAVFLDMFGEPVKNPKGWAKKSVGDSVELINGRAFKPSEWSKKGLPIVRIQNLKNPDDSFYNYFEGTCEDKYIVKAGDLLLSWAGQLVSFGIVVWTGPTGWLNQHIFRVVPKASFEISYLEFAFEYVIEEAKSKFHGIEMKHITRRDLVEYELLYPPIEIQREFALRAEKIKVIRANQNQALIQSNNLFHSLQQRAFNGKLFNGKATEAVLPRNTLTTSQPVLFD